MVQTLSLGAPILAIIVFVAVFVSLKDVNKSAAAVGALLASTCQVLFVAFYPLTLGLVHLSDQYASATGARQESLAAGAEGVVAVLDGYSPLYEGTFAISILILSLAMLQGVFPRAVAYLGFATAAAAAVALSLWPILGMGYFWWWLFFVVWFTGAGWPPVPNGWGCDARSRACAGRASTTRFRVEQIRLRWRGTPGAGFTTGSLQSVLPGIHDAWGMREAQYSPSVTNHPTSRRPRKAQPGGWFLLEKRRAGPAGRNRDIRLVGLMEAVDSIRPGCPSTVIITPPPSASANDPNGARMNKTRV